MKRRCGSTKDKLLLRVSLEQKAQNTMYKYGLSVFAVLVINDVNCAIFEQVCGRLAGHLVPANTALVTAALEGVCRPMNQWHLYFWQR